MTLSNLSGVAFHNLGSDHDHSGDSAVDLMLVQLFLSCLLFHYHASRPMRFRKAAMAARLLSKYLSPGSLLGPLAPHCPSKRLRPWRRALLLGRTWYILYTVSAQNSGTWRSTNVASKGVSEVWSAVEWLQRSSVFQPAFNLLS